MIGLDTTALSLLFVEGSTGFTKDGKPIKHAKERLEALIESISQSDQQILIPTPTLAEIFVRLEPIKIDELLKRLKSSPWFKVEAFDEAAAVELGIRTAKAIAAGDKWEGLQADHTKVKFDRQIVAIAIANSASEIISDDRDVAAVCERWNFPVRSVDQLPLPGYLIPPPLLAALEKEDEASVEPVSEDPKTPAEAKSSAEAGNGH